MNNIFVSMGVVGRGPTLPLPPKPTPHLISFGFPGYNERDPLFTITLYAFNKADLNRRIRNVMRAICFRVRN